MLSCLPFLAICLRQLWTASSCHAWRVYYVRRHDSANRIALRWNVHWCSVIIQDRIHGDLVLMFRLRFMIGFGLTFAASAAPVLVTELAYPSQRGPVTSLYNALWCVPSVSAVCAPLSFFGINAGLWAVSCEFSSGVYAASLAHAGFDPCSAAWTVRIWWEYLPSDCS